MLCLSRTLLDTVRPFEVPTWICLILSLVFIQFCMYLAAKGEENLLSVPLKHWSIFSRAAWYGYALFIGESITRDTKSKGAWATR